MSDKLPRYRAKLHEMRCYHGSFGDAVDCCLDEDVTELEAEIARLRTRVEELRSRVRFWKNWVKLTREQGR
jgi:cell division protein FtsB